ncbi:TetR family transcriptional regulator [Kribbella aluminosa]|uniref:TetR family transcriptional regulator n=1 Tax=Kribbella aluminosa TaxID=416017 RepID=UPI0035574805
MTSATACRLRLSTARRRASARSWRAVKRLRRTAQALQTRSEIADAALRLFVSQGWAATTARDVAREAGVSAPRCTPCTATRCTPCTATRPASRRRSRIQPTCPATGPAACRTRRGRG